MNGRLRLLADFLLSCRSADAVTPRLLGPSLLPILFVLELEREPTLRLRVRLVGTALGDALGRKLEGRYLEDFIHGPRAYDVIAGFHDVAKTKEPAWMRQVVQVGNRTPRFVEGVAVFLPPDRIYGGLIFGEATPSANAFERRRLVRSPASCESAT